MTWPRHMVSAPQIRLLVLIQSRSPSVGGAARQREGGRASERGRKRDLPEVDDVAIGARRRAVSGLKKVALVHAHVPQLLLAHRLPPPPPPPFPPSHLDSLHPSLLLRPPSLPTFPNSHM